MSRLHFRIHSAQIEIRAKLKENKKGIFTKGSKESVKEDELDSVMPLNSAVNSYPRNESEARKVIYSK